MRPFWSVPTCRYLSKLKEETGSSETSVVFLFLNKILYPSEDVIICGKCKKTPHYIMRCGSVYMTQTQNLSSFLKYSTFFHMGSNIDSIFLEILTSINSHFSMHSPEIVTIFTKTCNKYPVRYDSHIIHVCNQDLNHYLPNKHQR